MGSSYTPLKPNGATQTQVEDVYNRLKTHKVIEASQESYFMKRYSLPPASMVEDIEIGDDVNKSWVKFRDGNFVVFSGRVKWETIIRP